MSQTGLQVPWTVVAWVLGLVEGAILTVSICMVAFDSTRFKWFAFAILADAVAILITWAWVVNK